MTMRAAALQEASEHYLYLVQLSFCDGVTEAGKWWLDKEMTELEKDIEVLGLAQIFKARCTNDH